MTDYKAPYYLLFNAITDAVEVLGHLEVQAAVKLLEEAQLKAEELVLNQD